MKKILPIILAAVISGGLFFYIGTKIGKSPNLPSQGNLGQFSQNFAANRGQNGAQGGATAGSVISKDDKSITVQLRNGSSKIIFVSNSTQISKSAQGALSDLSVGQEVTVVGQANSDGSVTAQSIQIRPAIPAQTQGTSTKQ